MERGTRVRFNRDMGTRHGRPWKGQIGTVTHLDGDTDEEGKVTFSIGESELEEVRVEWDDPDFPAGWEWVEDLRKESVHGSFVFHFLLQDRPDDRPRPDQARL